MKFPIIIALIFTGCGNASWEDPSPRTVFEQFLISSARGRFEEAYTMVDPEDRPLLTQGDDVLPEELRPEGHERLVIGSVDSKFDIKRIELTQQFETEPSVGTSLELKLHYVDETTKPAYLVWRDGWYVDLIRKNDG